MSLTKSLRSQHDVEVGNINNTVMGVEVVGMSLGEK